MLNPAPAPKGNLLIIAQSGRMFAQSARTAGYFPHVVDLFGDDDTRLYSAAVEIVHDLSPKTIQAACSNLVNDGTPLVYGSGLDHDSELIGTLQTRYTVFGNTPETLDRLRDPRDFFGLLQDLNIPHPETTFFRPDTAQGWLSKAACGEGGKRVAFLANFQGIEADSHYFQRLVTGTPCSLLFLADGKSIQPVGFNTQLTTRRPHQPFLFVGAINHAMLAPEQKATAERAAALLTTHLGLQGLNSLDFMTAGSTIWVLEINARPSATAQLYDEAFPGGWVTAHIDACQSHLPSRLKGNQSIRGFQTVFAPADMAIPPDYNWPAHCSDLPRPGSHIPADRPICTVHTEAPDFVSAQMHLSMQERALLDSLNPQPNRTTHYH